MSKKIALIVDDSKTAQIRLRRLIEKYDMTVEVSFSAEQALTILPDMDPDIIFMDHTMDGMDGLEALRIIKSNPDTAMIPVIMYTAQSDEVYVGQAQALGALDTLSKDVFKASNIDDLMGRLKIPRKTELPPNGVDGHSAKVSTDTIIREDNPLYSNPDPQPSLSETQQLSNTQMLAALADAETPFLSAESTGSSTKSGPTKLGASLVAIKRLLGVQAHQIGDIQDLLKGMTLDELSLDGMPIKVLHEEAKKQREVIHRKANTGILFTVVCVALLGIFLVYFNQRFNEMNESIAKLTEANDNLTELIFASATFEDEPSDSRPVSNDLDLNLYIDTLNWLSNTDLHFGYVESPLNARQVANFEQLVERLSESGFTGTINLNIHFGNFCLTAAPDSDNWVLADDDASVIECTFYEQVKLDAAPETYLSIPYIQFEESSLPIMSGEIKVNVAVVGFAEPTVNYPGLNTVGTAKKWNAISARNNRISFEFLSDTD